MGQLLLFFLCNFSCFFSYVGGIPVTNHFSLLLILIGRQLQFGYSANYKTQGVFVILFLICSNFLNILRSLGTMVIITESGQNRLKVIFTDQFVPKVAIFRCFDVCSVWPPQIFKVQAKISTVRPVLPAYLPVSMTMMPSREFFRGLAPLDLREIIAFFGYQMNAGQIFVFLILKVTRHGFDLIQSSEIQKQPPEVFYRNTCSRNFTKFTRKPLCQSLFIKKVANPRPATLFKK